MVLSNRSTVLFLMVPKDASLVLASPLPTGPLCFFMSYVFKMLFLVMDKAHLLFIYEQVKRTTSRIIELSDIEFGSVLLVFKQRDSRTKFEKTFSLAMFLPPYEMSFGMM